MIIVGVIAVVAVAVGIGYLWGRCSSDNKWESVFVDRGVRGYGQ